MVMMFMQIIYFLKEPNNISSNIFAYLDSILLKRIEGLCIYSETPGSKKSYHPKEEFFFVL